MSIVQLPVWRIRGQSDRFALPTEETVRPHLQLVKPEAAPLRDYCDRCGAVIRTGALMHGRGVFCSVECSLEGPLTPA